MFTSAVKSLAMLSLLLTVKHFDLCWYIEGARGSVVGSGTVLQAQVADSISDEVIGFFN
jgi:hypothetical protein